MRSEGSKKPVSRTFIKVITFEDKFVSTAVVPTG